MTEVDVLVVGGGINSAGIARDAAGRGLKVLLCEQHDLASHTSSASTKLIHGGLRYLEHYDFRLVRKALQEREVLLEAAPHIIWPLRFVMPHDSHLRPAWMIRAGLFLYDHLAKRRRLPASESLDLRSHVAGAPLETRYARGFAYSDAWVDDARLVVLNAVDAGRRGAQILTRTRFVDAQRDGARWSVRLQPAADAGAPPTVSARSIVNAAGPWVGLVHDAALHSPAARHVRLVKGSHIVVPRLFDHGFAYLFQNPDRRIIFAIPYEQDFTLIGTTDVEHDARPDAPVISSAETEYLCAMANRYFTRKVNPRDVVASYSGLRPLLEDESTDPSSVTRDYSLELDRSGAPLLSVFGGKITTFRRLAEEATDSLCAALDCDARPWTRGTPLPGGDLPQADFAAFAAQFESRYPWLPPSMQRRLPRLYGSQAFDWLGDSRSPGDLGAELLPGLFEAEVRHLRDHEFAQCADDVLWRRTKLALKFPAESFARLDDWFASNPAANRRVA